MHEMNGSEVLSDPVAHISISGVHGRDELAARLKNSGRIREEEDSGLGRIVAGMLIGAAAMYLLNRFKVHDTSGSVPGLQDGA